MTDDGQDSRRAASPGTMIVIVGPSGAGKDTLMDYAAARLCGRPGFHFTRRVITRSGDAGVKTTMPFRCTSSTGWKMRAPSRCPGRRMG